VKSRSEAKVLECKKLLSLVAEWRAEGLTVAFTNGVFDILHRGHLHSIEQAASFCDRLIVAVNSDSSARSLGKGPERPINKEADRAALMAGFSAVDAVVIFDEPTPWELLKEIKPDVLAKGGDYKLEEIVGREFAGRVERLGLVQGLSTTKLVETIREGK
jgi:D-beta-D-heptose 7-phosphate kinase/D-beta-D-heptose 1-phosphate adenosyltransferase